MLETLRHLSLTAAAFRLGRGRFEVIGVVVDEREAALGFAPPTARATC